MKKIASKYVSPDYIYVILCISLLILTYIFGFLMIFFPFFVDEGVWSIPGFIFAIGGTFGSIYLTKFLRQYDASLPSYPLCVDEDNKILIIWHNNKQFRIGFKNIIKIHYRDYTFILVGRIVMPILHDYGKITIKYLEGNKIKHISSNDVNDVINVYTTITNYKNHF